MVVLCVVPLIPAVIIMGGSTIHPGWDRSGWRMAYLSSFWLVASTGIYCCIFEVWVGSLEEILSIST